MSPVLLGLGTNLGDRVANLRAAQAALARFLAIAAVSPLYETAPMYDRDQGAFLNQVAVVETDLAPPALLGALQQVERRLGRMPGRRNGPRPIDLDILFYGDRVVSEPGLDIPHPRMAERGFVLVPAADIAPTWRHPATGRSIAEMRAKLASGMAGVRPFVDQIRVTPEIGRVSPDFFNANGAYPLIDISR